MKVYIHSSLFNSHNKWFDGVISYGCTVNEKYFYVNHEKGVYYVPTQNIAYVEVVKDIPK